MKVQWQVITSHPVLLLPLYIYLKLASRLNELLRPANISCVVAFPITKQRYRTYPLFVLQRTCKNILVVWDMTFRDFQLLSLEGRRIFFMKGIYFTGKKGFARFALRSEGFDFVTATNASPPPSKADRNLRD